MFGKNLNYSFYILFQLVPYWERTFGINLGSPQIGVVDVEDVRLIYNNKKSKV